jgi:hypothetical protein
VEFDNFDGLVGFGHILDVESMKFDVKYEQDD